MIIEKMQIISVNIAQQKTININNKLVNTGIFKDPTSERIAISKKGLKALIADRARKAFQFWLENEEKSRASNYQ